MLTLICQYLHNWFDRGQAKYIGKITVDEDGNMTDDGKPLTLKNGQYFRIIGSTFNDGVHKYPASGVVPEEFEGAVWAMAVPPAVIALSQTIGDWMEKYGGVDSYAMSPYASESFDGYSYSKSSGNYSSGGSSASVTWMDVYGALLSPWRKLP